MKRCAITVVLSGLLAVPFLATQTKAAESPNEPVKNVAAEIKALQKERIAALTGVVETFRDLPADVKAQVDLRLTRPSNEINTSPFATLTSFEVHGESEDDGVIETMRRLGVKTAVMHNSTRTIGERCRR